MLLRKSDYEKEKKHPPKLQNTHVEFDSHLLENEVWLTTEEVMAHLNVSRSTMNRLRKQQNIPSIKLGHSPMYPKHLLNKIFIYKALGNINKR
ncbi:helix-turn-helix domain-containing protein [Polaribacter sp. Hel1_85]|uniref:helix-turn-helix domain-containing protein n=1 Tax=Polaribacter sp. Hel1_85 TaxID=1250005 RepID=UPI00055AC814|nr:helix-turn-helix domain-containing protein [Polaribacter sp. Hel1_85]